MSYKATVFNVMIASPGDVAQERAIIRSVIHEWNAIHSASRNIVLLPVGWETHSSPEMGESPQKIINTQVLKDCDLLIGVFWTRIGTATDEHSSGTVEEIEEHIATNKPAMLYFSSQPVSPDSVEPGQYEGVKTFRQSCQTRGLYESYDSLTEFKEKLHRQLQLKLNQHELFKDIEPDNVVVDLPPSLKIPSLSRESLILLKEASEDPHGTIMLIKTIGRTSLSVNRKEMIETQERREIAKWESAVQQLLTEGLIVDRGYKGEIFEITNEGYTVADSI